MKDEGNREDRRAARAEGTLDTAAFLKVADSFIDVANRQNQKVKATDLHMAFLYAASRYNAHVGKNIVEVEDQEAYVNEMMKTYGEMLRNHLADSNVYLNFSC